MVQMMFILLKTQQSRQGHSSEVMSGNKLVLQGDGTTNDALRISKQGASALDATVSVLEDV